MAAVIAYLTAVHSNFGRYAVITGVVNSNFQNFGHSQRGGVGDFPPLLRLHVDWETGSDTTSPQDMQHIF